MPMMTASNIHYETAGPRPQRRWDRCHPAAGANVGLIEEIDQKLHLLKRHVPYHQSDHVLNIAFNILAGGERLEHLELRCNDKVYLVTAGAQNQPPRGRFKTSH